MGGPYEQYSDHCACRINGSTISEDIYHQYCANAGCEACPVKQEGGHFEIGHYYHGELYEDRRE